MTPLQPDQSIDMGIERRRRIASLENEMYDLETALDEARARLQELLDAEDADASRS